jgi:hypothetical protein
MRTSYVPVMHCEKMAVTDMSFRQCAVIEFPVKEGNSARVIYRRLRGVYGDDCMGARSRTQYPRQANLWKLSFGIVRDANWSINATRYVQTLNKLRCALCENRPKKKSVILQQENARPRIARLTLQTIRKNGWELVSHPPYSPNLAPLKTTTCSGP